MNANKIFKLLPLSFIMKNCALCSILKSEEKRIILTTTPSFVCVNKEPLSKSHIMLLPQRHVCKLDELSAEEAQDLLTTIHTFSAHLQEKFNTQGALTILNHGKHKTQEHLHFHLLATDGNLRDVMSPYLKAPYRKELTLEELEKLASAIKDGLLN